MKLIYILIALIPWFLGRMFDIIGRKLVVLGGKLEGLANKYFDKV